MRGKSSSFGRKSAVILAVLLCFSLFSNTSLLTHAETPAGMYLITLESVIANSSDKAEEYGKSHTIDMGSHMEIGGYYNKSLTDTYKQITAFRFSAINLPEGAEIVEAYLEFTPDANGPAGNVSNMVIRVELGDAQPYQSKAYNISNRTYGSLSVNWQQQTFKTGQAVRTPDIKDLIEENRLYGWETGQALAFMIDGDNYLGSVYQGPKTSPPKMVITYLTTHVTYVNVISDKADKAEEYGKSHTIDMGSHMEIGGYYNKSLTDAYKQVTGFRFANVDLPQTAEIDDAYLEFTPDANGPAGNVSNMVIRAELGNAQQYQSKAYNISTRSYGELSVSWRQETLKTGQVIRTPDLKDLIEEKRSNGWESGQALAFMLDGDNFIGSVYQGPSSNPPTLVIKYHHGSGASAGGSTVDPRELKNVYLNEVSNGTSTCGEPWVEFYNANDAPVILDEGVFLTDDSIQNKYEFNNFLIPANGFKILYLNAKNDNVSANFMLDNTDAYVKPDMPTTPEDAPHLIINQVYGGGNADGAINYGFVELYNPTDNAVSLDAYSMQYFQNPTDQAGGWSTLPLFGTIPAYGSFLVVATGATLTGARYEIQFWDNAWPGMSFSNRSASFALVYGHTPLPAALTNADMANIVDLVGIRNSTSDTVYFFNGANFVDGISKQKSARRVNFSDTGDNSADFETIDYRASGVSDSKLDEIKPRWSDDGAWGSEIAPVDNLADHLIIHQVYGSGPLDNSGAISHSFIELYNPTDDPISLTGYSLQLQNGKYASNEPVNWEKYDFDGSQVVQPYSSFLIRLALAAPSARYVIPQADIDWTNGRVFSNRAYSAALVDNQNLLSQAITPGEMAGVVDLMGALNTAPQDNPLNYEGAPVDGISKQKSARRVNFSDTDDNSADFETIDYRASSVSDSKLDEIKPRWSGDGAWGVEIDAPTTPSGSQQSVLTSRTLTLSTYYDGEYHIIDQLPYYQTRFGETYGRFTDGSDQTVKYDNNGTFGKSNNTAIPFLTYSVSKNSGQYADPIDVVIATDDVNCVMYTLDGSIPSEISGIPYSGPIHIDQSATLRLYIYNDRQNSGVLTYVYEIGPDGLELRQKTVSRPISAGGDDLRATTSAVNLTETSLFLNGKSGSTDLTTYLRFTDIELPEDAVITNAYIVFTTRTSSTSPTRFTITGELGDGAAFNGNISSVNGRAYTNAYVINQTPASVAAGVSFNTGDLTAVLNEMRAFNSGLTSYVFKAEGDKNGSFTAQSYEGNKNSAPTLIIEYFSGYDKYVGFSANSNDSAEEYGTGHKIDLNSRMEIGGYRSATLSSTYKQISGFRFPNVTIPDDAEITDAYMEFTVYQTVSSNVVSNMVIKAESGHPAVYASTAYNISDRTYGNLSISYQQPAFKTRLDTVRTPNLKDLIEENRLNGWQSGQALAFMIDGDNYIGNVYQTGASYAPILVIHYKYSGNGASITGAVTESESIQNVFVNEVSAEGTSSSKDSWVELYNANDFPVILGSGTYLSDKANALNKFPFDNLLIPAKGYRVISCDGYPELGPAHAGFTLSSSGTVYLSTADATGKITALDSLAYGNHLYNQTYGRIPDGNNDIVLFQSETYGVSNEKGQVNYPVTVDHDRGVYDAGFNLSISASKPSVTIKYSVDGVTTPSASKGIVYTGPIAISKSCVIKIYAYDQAGNSGLQAYTYILKDNLKNETTSGAQWKYKSTITGEEYAKALSCFPIVSVTSDSGNNLVARADYVQSTFEFIDAHLDQGNHNYFSNCGAKKFGQASVTWYNSGVDVKFHRDYNTKKAKVDFFGPLPEDPFPTPIKYTKLQLKEGEDGPQSDVWNLGYLRYSDCVVHSLGIEMGKFDLRARYVQYFFNGKYCGLKTLREAFSDGTFENYFGDDSSDYTVINFQDSAFGNGSLSSGNASLLTAIKKTVTDKNFQEFKKYVDINDFIKFQILFMFTDTEREAEAILHNDAYNGGGMRMITNINDLDGAFFNNGKTGATASSFVGGGGTYRYKWGNALSRKGVGGWFGVFSGDSASNATAGNLEFKTLVKDQVLAQIGPNSGDLAGAPGAPLSVDNVQYLIAQNFEELNSNYAYKVDAAYMGARSGIYQDWLNMQPKVQNQTVDRVKYSLQMWSTYGMAHTLSSVTFTNTGSGIVLNNPNNTDVYYTTDGADPMGPDGVISASAVKYIPSTVLPDSVILTVRPFAANNWGPLTSK